MSCFHHGPRLLFIIEMKRLLWAGELRVRICRFVFIEAEERLPEKGKGRGKGTEGEWEAM